MTIDITCRRAFKQDTCNSDFSWRVDHPRVIVGIAVYCAKKIEGFKGNDQSLEVSETGNSEIMSRELLLGPKEINFLCVHKKLQSKRLAWVLIEEVARRVHLEDF